MFYFLNSILDQVVKAWIETRGVDESPEALQDLVEVVMTLKSAAERMTGQALEINSGPLSSQLTKYASILAAQVCIRNIPTYFSDIGEILHFAHFARNSHLLTLLDIDNHEL